MKLSGTAFDIFLKISINSYIQMLGPPAVAIPPCVGAGGGVSPPLGKLLPRAFEMLLFTGEI